mgnify:CR=1 FL=1
MSNYALRIPYSLFDFAKKCARQDNVSLNQFIVLARAEPYKPSNARGKTTAYLHFRFADQSSIGFVQSTTFIVRPSSISGTARPAVVSRQAPSIAAMTPVVTTTAAAEPPWMLNPAEPPVTLVPGC